MDSKVEEEEDAIQGAAEEGTVATGSRVLRFSVKDYGKGIDAKDIKSVFQPFNQGGKETPASLAAMKGQTAALAFLEERGAGSALRGRRPEALKRPGRHGVEFEICKLFARAPPRM